MQWSLVVAEEFSNSNAPDWEMVMPSKDSQMLLQSQLQPRPVTVSQCRNGLFLLGGFEGLAMEGVKKTFKSEW